MSSPTAAPVSKFRELSLASMSPTTRSQALRQSIQAAADSDDPSFEPDSDSGSSSSSEDNDDDDDDDSDSSVIISPSRLSYRVDGLSQKTRKRVRDTFKKPPQFSLKLCRPHTNRYAFQMTEVVCHSIRIGGPNSEYAKPECSCTGERRPNKPPCKHLIWLLDQLVKQALYDQDPTSPLTMTADGYPEEMGDLFSDISAFHLDVLADSLHCNDVNLETSGAQDSDSDDDDDDDLDPVPHRVQEIREMLSAIDSSAPEDFRPDLLSGVEISASRETPIKFRDLQGTIFRMLLANDEFFHYFLSHMSPTDPVNDPFRKLSQRVDRVLRDLDAHAAGRTPSPSSPFEGPCDVAWAAHHITGVVRLIRTAIFKRDLPLEFWEQTSAARALVHVLSAVVERNRDFVAPGATGAAALPRADRNLYLRLVGDHDEDFVLGVLNLLPPTAAAQFVHSLEIVQDQLGVNGAPGSYVERFRALMTRLRRASGASSSSAGTAAGSKRQSQAPDRGSKRIK